MKFGIFLPQGWRLDLVGVAPENQWQTMLDFARKVEAGPWESLWVYDHFHTVPMPTDEATHEAWTLMAALAATTRRLRLGQMCSCMGYRNPAYLAKVAATCDVISGGRVEMGIGAGWYQHEWRAYGYGFPAAGDRLGMLDEGVQIMRQLWTDGIAKLDGKHYQVDGAICRPLPLQQGGLPMWIAGGGERKTLRIAAKYAQYTNFDATPETFRRKSAVLEEHCRDIGRDFGEIVRSGNYNVVIGETEKDVRDKLAWLLDHYKGLVSADQAERTHKLFSEGPLVGTPEQLVERLKQAEGTGMTYAIGYFVDAIYDPASVEMFATQVIPELG
jgi:F420-dependent oxidoreductase-like protein